MKNLSIIIPESVECYSQVADHVSKVFARLFGGFNQYEGRGGWVDDSGELVSERHIKVEAFVQDGIDLVLRDSSDLLDAFQLVLLNQDCIAASFDGNAEILDNQADIIAFLWDNIISV